MKCGLKLWLASGVLRGAVVALLFSLFAATSSAQAAAFQDYFTNRESIFTTNGTLLGTNINATIESNEPRHGGKAPSHSIWITWVAPTNGIATFDTHGSDFDTLLSAYTLSPTNGTTVGQLHEEAENDDDPGNAPASLIQIGAIAGQSYQIAVDGFDGATGQVVFHWSFIPASEPPPIIVSTPNDQAAKQGDPVSLTVNLIQSGDAQLHWYFNEDTNSVGQGTNLFIPSLQPTNVGRYKLRVTVGSGNNRVRFFTTPVEVQINSEGVTNTLATDKLFDSLGSPMIGSAPAAAPTSRFALAAASVGVVRGYNGSQVFNTTYATADPLEPAHCGIAGGSSYWLMYQPPTNGVLAFDTKGSTYDTVMEVYTYNGALTNYSNLISIGCDNNGVGSNGWSRVSFQAVKTRSYVIAVDGVGGAFGTAWLNYALSTNLPAQAPNVSSLVVTQSVLVGGNITIAPSVSGAPPLVYSWKKNGATIQGLTVPFLQITNANSSHAATYALTITNDLGSTTISNILHVVTPMNCNVSSAAGQMNLNFATVNGLRYTIESAASVAGPWAAWRPAFLGNGENFSTNLQSAVTTFFRVRID